jgi:hypothetical protein
MKLLDSRVTRGLLSAALVLLLAGGCHGTRLMRLSVPVSEISSVSRATREWSMEPVRLHAAGTRRVEVDQIHRVRVVTTDGRFHKIPASFLAIRAGDRLILRKSATRSLSFSLEEVDYLSVDATIPKPYHVLDYVTVGLLFGAASLIALSFGVLLSVAGDHEVHPRTD